MYGTTLKNERSIVAFSQNYEIFACQIASNGL